MGGMSASERSYLLAGCRANCRVDGRTCTAFRSYSIQVDNNNSHGGGSSSTDDEVVGNTIVGDSSLLPFCHGSARLVGSTGHAAHETQHLLCTVKADLVRPSLQQPEQGIVEVHVQFATGTTTTGGGSSSSHVARREVEQQTQILLSQWVVPHLLVDTYALCLHPKALAWRLAVDVYILEASGGSLVDCAARVVAAALLQATRLPKVEVVVANTTTQENNNNDSKPPLDDDYSSSSFSFTVDGDWAKSLPVPCLHRTVDMDPMDAPCCIVITVAVLLDYDLTHRSKPIYTLLLDPNVQEETCALALIHVAVAETGKGRPPQVVGLHKTHTGALPMTLLSDISQMALQAVATANQAFCIQRLSLPVPNLHADHQDYHRSTLLQEKLHWHLPQHR